MVTTRISKNVLVVDLPMKRSTSWEQWIMLSSDRHHDHMMTDQALEKRHLEKAVKRNAYIIDNGD